MTGKTIILACLAVCAGLLGACSGESSATPPVGPVEPQPTQIPSTAMETVTATPSAASSPVATSTSTASPAPTDEPTPTDQPTAEPTGTAVRSADNESREAERLDEGRWQQLIGNCDMARRTFADLLAADPDPTTASEARYRMAQCYLRDEAPAEAWATLAELLKAAPPDDPHRAPAQFLLGEALTALGNWEGAEAAYKAYLTLAPELAYLTQQRIGEARRGRGDLAGATEAYRAALDISPDQANASTIRRALANLALEQGDFPGAVAQYDALRRGETKGALAAEMHYLAGLAFAKEALAAAILPAATAPATTSPLTEATPAASIPLALAEAQERWQRAVDADITSRWAHTAIVALLDSGAVVDEYQRGRVNYHNQGYALAIAAFDRLRDENGVAARVPGDAWYYAGLSYLALGNANRGLTELEYFIANYPDDPLWAEAWLAKGQAQARAGQRGTAIATYRLLAETRPTAALAPVALWRAAVLGDDEPPRTAAADAYLALARRYPNSADAWRAYQGAGLIYFRLGDWGRATETWREMATKAELPSFSRPVARFWLGRALLAGGDRPAAEQAWRDARQADPYNFFSLRAAAWSEGTPNAWVRESAERPVQAPASRSTDAPAEIAAWLLSWAGEGNLGLEGIASDPDWVRGRTLLDLGLRAPALAIWERVRTRHAENAWTSAALALAFRDAGAHRLSLLCAERVAVLWGRPMRDAPDALQRLAYPIPFAALIEAEAEKLNLDPRLLAAIIRQESRFEGGATSVAGAQGLMQVMPGTAEGIARQLNWPAFETRQAYWPYVNVTFGAFYVRQWLTHFDGSLFAALAAYNGGPGNAAVWHRWAPDDDDLMAALINISETRVYVQAVWANYEVYRRLYPD